MKNVHLVSLYWQSLLVLSPYLPGCMPFKRWEFPLHDRSLLSDAFSFWSFLMWALMVWAWVWVVQMLWRVDKQAWLFLAVITVFNLILDITVMLGAGQWSDVSLSSIVNAIILIYVMLPGVKRAFDVIRHLQTILCKE